MVRTIVSTGLAAALAAGLASASPAQGAAGLCNTNGKIEVMGEASDIACGADRKSEIRALLKARQYYSDDSRLEWQKRAMIDARIQQRLRQLWKAKSS